MRTRVAILHHEDSFFPLEVHHRIRDEVEPIWVVNTEVDPADGILRLLARLGPVVDMAGLDLDESATRLGAESPQGIVSFVDDTIEYAAALAERLGLRYHTPEVAAIVVDKGRQRAVFERAGIPCPRFRRLPDTPDRAHLARLMDGLAYPTVIKPLRASGSRGVRRASDFDELIASLSLDDDGRDISSRSSSPIPNRTSPGTPPRVRRERGERQPHQLVGSDRPLPSRSAVP